MRVLVFSRFSTAPVDRLLRAHTLTPVRTDPDVVLCWGGDGTFLLAETRYPGVPKLIVRKESLCRTCQDIPLSDIIPLLARGKLKVREEPKLDARIGTRLLPLATNDVIVRNAHPAHALRFTVRAGKPIGGEQVGDGVVVCTPFGSSAYYHSITRTTFTSGIGVAMNNTLTAHPAYVVDATVTVQVTRGDALVAIDTLDRTWRLRTGDRITVRRSRAVARILTL